MKLVDVHAHLQFSSFDEDREAVVQRAREAGIGVINVGTDLATSRQAVDLAERNDEMWATVGIHPTDLPEADKTDLVLAELKKMVSYPRVVGVGECGLDYFHVKDERGRKKQAEIFKQQVKLALAVDKPLMIHCRGAYQDLYHILVSDFGSAGSKLKANIHFFVGSWAEAKLFLDLGFSLSFTGVITFTNQYDEVIKNMPLDRLLTETDCPFVPPQPWRGRRNEPIYVAAVVKRLAELRGFALETVAATILTTAKRVFAL